MNRELDSELRTVLRSHAESVQPTDHLGAIRARTQNDPAMQWWRRPLVLAGGAALVAASVVVGAVLLATPDSRRSDPPVASKATYEVTLYGIDQVAMRLWLYPELVTTEDTGDPALDAVRALQESVPEDLAMECGLGVDPQSVEVGARSVTIDFAESAGGLAYCAPAEQAQEARRQQLAWTVRSASGWEGPVRVTVDGRPVTPVFQTEVTALSPVLIDTPAEGATFTGPVRVTGTSDTFEANVQWQVLRDGKVVDEGFTSGGTMGERGPFQFTVDLPPGTYTARAYATSAEDGRLVAENTKTFTVR